MDTEEEEEEEEEEDFKIKRVVYIYSIFTSIYTSV